MKNKITHFTTRYTLYIPKPHKGINLLVQSAGFPDSLSVMFVYGHLARFWRFVAVILFGFGFIYGCNIHSSGGLYGGNTDTGLIMQTPHLHFLLLLSRSDMSFLRYAHLFVSMYFDDCPSPSNNVVIFHEPHDILLEFRTQYPHFTNDINDLMYRYNDLSRLINIHNPGLATINQRLVLMDHIISRLDSLIRGIAPQGETFDFTHEDSGWNFSTYDMQRMAYETLVGPACCNNIWNR